jgi:hypothetical protein
MGAPFDATVALAEQAALPFAQFVLPADHASLRCSRRRAQIDVYLHIGSCRVLC